MGCKFNDGWRCGWCFGSFLFSKKIGRKKSLVIGAALFIIGSVGSGLAPTVDILIGSRLILGLSVGSASYTAP